MLWRVPHGSASTRNVFLNQCLPIAWSHHMYTLGRPMPYPVKVKWLKIGTQRGGHCYTQWNETVIQSLAYSTESIARGPLLRWGTVMWQQGLKPCQRSSVSSIRRSKLCSAMACCLSKSIMFLSVAFCRSSIFVWRSRPILQSLWHRLAVAVAASDFLSALSAFLILLRTSAAIFLSLASSVLGVYGRPCCKAFPARARTLTTFFLFFWATFSALDLAILIALLHAGFFLWIFESPRLHRVSCAGFFWTFLISLRCKAS